MDTILDDKVKNFVESTGYDYVRIVEKIQDLWNGYGQLIRLQLGTDKSNTIILKLIQPNQYAAHPRGWATEASYKRKVRSYEVELSWYSKYVQRQKFDFKVPAYLGSKMEAANQEKYLLIEDLKTSRFVPFKGTATISEVKYCLKWLAQFHGHFLGREAKGLWQVGTYWHLDTRQDEYKSMKVGSLKSNATNIDKALRNAKFQTIVHGDAKLANFCINHELKSVAAVDFQYVGGGCGMKDVCYLLSSCFHPEELNKYEDQLLDFYFEELRLTISEKVFDELELEWRKLYPIAWLDFVRFLKGWSPSHYKLDFLNEKKIQTMLQSEALLNT